MKKLTVTTIFSSIFGALLLLFPTKTSRAAAHQKYARVFHPAHASMPDESHDARSAEESKYAPILDYIPSAKTAAALPYAPMAEYGRSASPVAGHPYAPKAVASPCAKSAKAPPSAATADKVALQSVRWRFLVRPREDPIAVLGVLGHLVLPS